MPSIDVIVRTDISRSVRARQLEGMFDVPAAEKSELRWKFDAPFEAEPWSVGLIVGPSGCGKTTIARDLFGAAAVAGSLDWQGKAVIDDFPEGVPMKDIAAACSAVGFNTIPAWLRPFSVLSNGEQFRATLARRLIEGGDPIVFDEFTSVVDRQVAKIASHAVQKHVRRSGQQFVAVTCHDDVIDWLQPDWIINPSTRNFARRSVQRRPELAVEISPVPYAAWKLFAPFHYLTAELHRNARCFCLFVDGRPAAFAGLLLRPNTAQSRIMGISRLVTLPDYQGLGLAFVLIDKVASWFKTKGVIVHNYPAHPALVRAHDRSPVWQLRKKPGVHTNLNTQHRGPNGRLAGFKFGGRPNAVFRYVGPAADPVEADRVLSYWPGSWWESNKAARE